MGLGYDERSVDEDLGVRLRLSGALRWVGLSGDVGGNRRRWLTGEGWAWSAARDWPTPLAHHICDGLNHPHWSELLGADRKSVGVTSWTSRGRVGSRARYR